MQSVRKARKIMRRSFSTIPPFTKRRSRTFVPTRRAAMRAANAFLNNAGGVFVILGR